MDIETQKKVRRATLIWGLKYEFAKRGLSLTEETAIWLFDTNIKPKCYL